MILTNLSVVNLKEKQSTFERLGKSSKKQWQIRLHKEVSYSHLMRRTEAPQRRKKPIILAFLPLEVPVHSECAYNVVIITFLKLMRAFVIDLFVTSPPPALIHFHYTKILKCEHYSFLCVCWHQFACSRFCHGMYVWVCIWTWWGHYVLMCALVWCMCVYLCATWKVHVRDSDSPLVFWWARWVTAAVAEQAEVDNGKGWEADKERGQLFI